MPWSSVISFNTLNILALEHCGACHAHEVSRENNIHWYFGHCRPEGVECPSGLSAVSADGFDIVDDGGFIKQQVDKLTKSKFLPINVLMNSWAVLPFP